MSLDLTDVALLTQQNRELLKQLIGEFVTLRDIISGGLNVNNFPELPAPVINLPEQVVPTAQEFNPSALTAALGPVLNSNAAQVSERFTELKQVLESLSTAVQETTRNQPMRMGGGKNTVRLKDKDDKLYINPASEETLKQVRDTGATESTLLNVLDALGDSPTQQRLDYDTRTDSNPVYVGKADEGTAEATSAWTVQKLTYDTDGRLTAVDTQENIAWSNRTVGW